MRRLNRTNYLGFVAIRITPLPGECADAVMQLIPKPLVLFPRKTTKGDSKISFKFGPEVPSH